MISVSILLASTISAYADFTDTIYPVISIFDDDTDVNGATFDTLYGASYITTVVIGGSTFALVTSYSDHGIQIIDISDPTTPLAVYSLNTDSGYDAFEGISDINTVKIHDKTYLLVLGGFNEDSFHIIDITDPYEPKTRYIISDGDTDVNGVKFDALYEPLSVTTVVISGKTYALVTAENGIQIIDISIPISPIAVASIFDGDNYENFHKPNSIDTMTVGDKTYTFVLSDSFGGYLMIDITDPYEPVDKYVIDKHLDDNITNLRDITIVEIGDATYALLVDIIQGLLIVDITDPLNPVDVSPITNENGTFLAAIYIDTVVIDGVIYALVTVGMDDSIQIIDISNPYNPDITYTLDTATGFDDLDMITDITIVEIGDSAYVVVISGSVQIIHLFTAESETEVSDEIDTESETSKKSNGSANKHLTRPTFGINHKTHTPFVTGGFTFNNNTFDITHNFWTPFEKQTIETGDTSTISATVYAPMKLRIQEFLFGIPVVGDAHLAELGIEIHYDYNNIIEDIKVIQKSKVIDADSLIVTHLKSKCSESDVNEICDTTYLSMIFLEPLKNDVMAIKAIDYKGRTQITYLNEGFNISGDSLNPMLTKMIAGTEKHEGLIEITQTQKYSNIWVSDDNRLFEQNDYDSFTQINKSYERHHDTGDPKNRLHSEFTKKQQYVTEIANEMLEKICPRCNDKPFNEINDIFSYETTEPMTRSNDIELQKKG